MRTGERPSGIIHAPTDSPAAAIPKSTLEPKHWLLLAAAIFFVELLLRGRHGAFSSRGPEAYWAFHWARDYSAGFQRRGLLGATLRLLHIDNTDYRTILLGALSISTALYALFMASLYRLVRDLTHADGSYTALILALSPLTAGMIIETTGDPLQLLMLCCLGLFWLIVLPNRSAVLSAIAFAILGAAGALIHEACIFFVFPALAVAAFVLQQTRTARAALYGNLVGGVLCTALVIAATPTTAQPIARPTALHYHGTLLPIPTDAFLPFARLISIEVQRNFGHGLKGDMLTLVRVIGVLTLPTLLVCILTALFFSPTQSSPATRRKVYLAFLVPLILSAPLYIMGFDWGRFSSYSFILSLSILALWAAPANPTQTHALTNAQPAIALGLLVAGVTMVPLPEGYIWNGMIYARNTFFAEFAVFALLLYKSRRYWRTTLAIT